MTTTTPTDTPTFDPVKHGPALWSLQGLRWSDKEMPNARIFKGWTADRLAVTLGLDPADVAAALTAGPDAPRPGLLGRVREALQDAAAAGVAVPEIGSTWRPPFLMMLHPFPGGGYTTDPKAAATLTEMMPITSDDEVKVHAVRGGQVIVTVTATDPAYPAHPPYIVRVPLERFARRFKSLGY